MQNVRINQYIDQNEYIMLNIQWSLEIIFSWFLNALNKWKFLTDFVYIQFRFTPKSTDYGVNVSSLLDYRKFKESKLSCNLFFFKTRYAVYKISGFVPCMRSTKARKLFQITTFCYNYLWTPRLMILIFS